MQPTIVRTAAPCAALPGDNRPLATTLALHHRRQRRLIQPSFYRRRIEAYAMAADAAAERQILAR